MGRAYLTERRVRHDGVRHPAGVEIDLDGPSARDLLARGAIRVVEGEEIDAGWPDGVAPHEADGRGDDGAVSPGASSDGAPSEAPVEADLLDAVRGLDADAWRQDGLPRAGTLKGLAETLKREVGDDEVMAARAALDAAAGPGTA